MNDESIRLDAARRAVADACAVCRAVQNQIEQVRSLTKDDRSPVTVADFASQAVIAHRLTEALGPVRLIGEEDADALRQKPELVEHVVEAVRLVWPDATPDDALDAIDAGGDGAGQGDFWTLDPIDGTKGFLRNQQYAISLAWIESGRPTLGLLGCPNLSADHDRPFDDPDPHGVMYVAQQGGGTVEYPADDPHAPPKPLPRPDAHAGPIRACESVEAEHTNQSASGRVYEHLGVEPAHAQRLDSQAKYAVVARGQADLYLRLPTKKGYVEKIWDHAAGALVAVEAGCRATDILGAELDFGRGIGLEANRGVVCAATALHERVIGAIAELGLAATPA